MSEQPAGDKSFDATPERKRKARRKGNVAVSPEVAAVVSVLGLILALGMAGSVFLKSAERLFGAFNRPEEVAASLLAGGGAELSEAGAWPVLALVLPPAILVLLGIAVQGGLLIAPSKLKPDLKKIAPHENAKKKYGAQGLTEFLRAGIKLTGVAALGGGYLYARRDDYLAMTGMPVEALPGLLRSEIVAVLMIAALLSGLAAVIDLPLRRMRHAAKLKMTRQEVTDETKEQEGDPTQKQARKQRAAELSRNQMLRDAGEADVVIVNPTHYAVALKWDRSEESVPTCVAKGVDHLALAIRDRAALSGVPIREDVACARALHAAVGVGEPIRPEHYAAVAAAIRYAERIRSAAPPR